MRSRAHRFVQGAAVSAATCGVMCAALLGTTALAGRVQGDAALDVFHANSTGAGDPGFAGAQELGLGLGLRFFELDDDLRVRALYRGREPLGGDVQNPALRTLWEANVAYRFLDDAVDVTAGRFLRPSPLLLVIDGAAVDVTLPLGFTAGAFAGRRGLTSSLRESGLDKWLPAVGANVGWRHELVDVSLYVDWARDEAIVPAAADSGTAPSGGLDALLSTSSRPAEWLLVGAQAGFIQQGQYVIGPTWSTVELEAQVVNLWNALGYVDWRPWDFLRVGYDVHWQRPAVVRTATLVGTQKTPELVDPSFFDNRLHAAVAPFSLGWVRGGVRHRLRPDRQELRYFAQADLEPKVAYGVYASGRLAYEDLLPFDEGAPPAADRVLGAVSVGWHGFGFDAQTGLSYIERSATPLSARMGNADVPVDLSPFVLDAQRLFFLRGSYEMDQVFVAVDVQRNLEDNEYRGFLIVGGRMEVEW